MFNAPVPLCLAAGPPRAKAPSPPATPIRLSQYDHGFGLKRANTSRKRSAVTGPRESAHSGMASMKIDLVYGHIGTLYKTPTTRTVPLHLEYHLPMETPSHTNSNAGGVPSASSGFSSSQRIRSVTKSCAVWSTSPTKCLPWQVLPTSPPNS
jgi:hypothetical protein